MTIYSRHQLTLPKYEDRFKTGTRAVGYVYDGLISSFKTNVCYILPNGDLVSLHYAYCQYRKIFYELRVVE